MKPRRCKIDGCHTPLNPNEGEVCQDCINAADEADALAAGGDTEEVEK